MSTIPMEVSSGPSTSSSASTRSVTNEDRRLSIQRCINSLTHSAKCKSSDCQLPSCMKMKRVVSHSKTCRRKTNGGCQICKQLVALCCYHAKYCTETVCSVPFCANIKVKLTAVRAQQQLEQRQLLRRRMDLIVGLSSSALRSATVTRAGVRPPTLTLTESQQLFRTRPEELVKIMKKDLAKNKKKVNLTCPAK